MEEKRKYRPLGIYSDEEIHIILKKGSYEELVRLPLEIGMNHCDWKFAQDICLKLTEYEDEVIRVNSILGLAYIARTKLKLEKHLVKPVLFRESRRAGNFKKVIEDAVYEINLFLQWNIV